MEVYDFGLDFVAFYQALMAVLIVPIALSLGYEFGILLVVHVMRWIRNHI